MTMVGQLCTAVVGDVRVGIHATDVRELVRDRHITPIPLADAAVRGLMNLRGDLVTVLDLRVRLGRAPHPEPACGVHIVLRGDPARSLLVDAIDEVVDIADDTRVKVPANLDTAVGRLIDDAVAPTGGVVLVLDTTRVATVPTCRPPARSSPERSREP